MDETIKLLRTLHNALCVVGAAILLITITTYQASRYEKALSEITDLKKLNWGAYGEFALNSYLTKEIKLRAIEKTRNDYISTFESDLRMKIPKNVQIKTLPLVTLVQGTGTVGVYRGFLSGQNQVGYYVPPNAHSIASIVSDDLDRRTDSPDTLSRAAKILFVDFTPFYKSHNIQRLTLASEEEILTRPLIPAQLDGITNLYFTTPNDRVVHKRITLGDAYLISRKGPFVYEWLKSIHSSLVLSQRESPPVIALPNSAPFASEIDSMTLDEAAGFLTSRIKEREQNFSFLGQSLASNLTGLVAPTILVGILLLFTIYQRHLSSSFVGKQNKLVEFPWFGLYSDNLSRTTFVVTVGLLPTGSVALCSIFFMDVGSMVFIFTLFALLCVGTMSVMIVLENRRLLAAIAGMT